MWGLDHSGKAFRKDSEGRGDTPRYTLDALCFLSDTSQTRSRPVDTRTEPALDSVESERPSSSPVSDFWL